MISTTLFTGLRPAASSRCCNQAGEGATVTPLRAVIEKRLLWALKGPGSRPLAFGPATTPGACMGTCSMAATSLAMPSIESPSGRLAVIANSRIRSSSPSSGATASPSSGKARPLVFASSSKSTRPSALVWRPSSAKEQSMPQLSTPRSTAGLIVRFTAGKKLPRVATATAIPSRTFGAPQTI